MDLLRNPQPLRDHARTKRNPFDEMDRTGQRPRQLAAAHARGRRPLRGGGATGSVSGGAAGRARQPLTKGPTRRHAQPTDRSLRCCTSSPRTSRRSRAGPWRRSSLVAMSPPSPRSSTPTSSTTTALPARRRGWTAWPGPCTCSKRRSRTGAGRSTRSSPKTTPWSSPAPSMAATPGSSWAWPQPAGPSPSARSTSSASRTAWASSAGPSLTTWTWPPARSAPTPAQPTCSCGCLAQLLSDLHP